MEVNSDLEDWEMARELAKLGKVVSESNTEPRVVSYRIASYRIVPGSPTPIAFAFAFAFTMQGWAATHRDSYPFLLAPPCPH